MQAAGLVFLDSMGEAVSLMVRWVMVIGAVIAPVLGARVPVETELALAFVAANPVEAGIHRICLLLDDDVVDHAGGIDVVSLDRRGRLWSYHFNQGLMNK